MKTIAKQIVLILCLTLCIFNCSKDDDLNENPIINYSQLLVGKWYLYRTDGNPVGCFNQFYYHFTDGTNLTVEEFITIDDGLNCTSFGIQETNYTIENNVVEFSITSRFVSEPKIIKLTIISISDTELTAVRDTNGVIQNIKMTK